MTVTTVSIVPMSATGTAMAELSPLPMGDHAVLRSSVTGGATCDGAPDTTIYVLHQRFRYDYETPVHHLRHRLVVVPRAVHGDQRRVDHRVTVTGAPALVSVSLDGFGNHVVDVRATRVDEAIEFEAWALVRRGTGSLGRRGELLGPRAAGVTTLAPAAVGDRRLLAATDLTRADGILADAADSLGAARSPAGPPRAMELAERVCGWSHRALTYAYGATGVRTSAAEAVAGGRGLCQDYAHVMLAVCRAAGLPARYVSGHLVGEGGSHAWVEVIVADANADGPGRAKAVAFDPTHDRRAGEGYLTVAVGRDYADVAPTSGTFEGAGPGVLTSRKRLGVEAADDASTTAG
ncbi:MAG: transglutaminase family protein [Actinomycetota bacterium]|nr:transglutaminase family protein [Actinomycetota bacterium]